MPAIQSIPAFSQTVGSDGIARLNLDISRIRNPSTDANVPAPGGIGGYDLTITYPGGTSGNAVNILAVTAVGAFTTVTSGTTPSTSGSLSINSFQTGAAPQPPLTLVQIAPRILGSKNVSHNITLSLTSLVDVATAANMPPDGPRAFAVRRGDAKADGNVTIADALFIAQYLVGIRGIGDNAETLVHAINAASVRTDSDTGDKVTIADALLIAQMLAGLRDDSFNTPT